MKTTNIYDIDNLESRVPTYDYTGAVKFDIRVAINGMSFADVCDSGESFADRIADLIRPDVCQGLIYDDDAALALQGNRDLWAEARDAMDIQDVDGLSDPCQADAIVRYHIFPDAYIEALEDLAGERLPYLTDTELVFLYHYQGDRDMDTCREIAKRAGLLEEWDKADEFEFETVLDEALERVTA